MQFHFHDAGRSDHCHRHENQRFHPDILKKYPAEVLRFFIVATHYRSPLDFADERLQEAAAGLARLQKSMENLQALAKIETVGNAATAKDLRSAEETAKKSFYEAMEDDFNTALALSFMFSLGKEINIYYQQVTTGQVAFDPENFAVVKAAYQDMADILGILEETETSSEAGNEEAQELLQGLMELILDLRQQARSSKNWAMADQIRDQLKELNIQLEDSPTGARWKRG